MANFSVPNIEIPFDMLTNEQREAVYLVMTGEGFQNPQAPKIKEAKKIVEEEHAKILALEIHPFDQSRITEQQIIELDYWLTLIKYWLDVLKLHTDKLSGVESEYVGDLVQRLSIAGLYTRVMKTITGMDREQHSEIFGSLSVLGDNIIGRIHHLSFCETSSNYCDIDTSSSGLQGLAGVVQRFPVTIPSIITCLLPTIVDKLKSLIENDEQNFCKAKRVIERYSYGTKIIETLDSDPIFGAAMQSVFATPQLQEAILAIRNPNPSTTTNEFFPQFNLESTGPCLIEDQLISIGPAGPTGAHGGRGITGSPGIPGPVGDCNCGETNNQGEESPCWQGGGTEGACCVCGYCVSATEFQCFHYGGEFYGENSSCSVINCLPSGCSVTADCALGMICCGGQCTTPCSDNTCPPCPQCPEGTTVCGDTCCAGTTVCCNGFCYEPCLDGTCPDCQGECCPQGTSCCGGDGCCLEGNCCEDECCGSGMSGKTCLDGGCLCCPPGESCLTTIAGNECCNTTQHCDGKCCDDLSKCCNGECVPIETVCECLSGFYECEFDDTFHCCPNGNSCCRLDDGTPYCCSGECCENAPAGCCSGNCISGNCCPDNCEMCTEEWQGEGTTTHCICYSPTEDKYYDHFTGEETTYCGFGQSFIGGCGCRCDSNDAEPCGMEHSNLDCWEQGGCCCPYGETCWMEGNTHYCCLEGTTNSCGGECCGSGELCCVDRCTVCDDCNKEECINEDGETFCCDVGESCCNGECKNSSTGNCCCATNPNTAETVCVWSEHGCCPHNDHQSWLEWNNWQPIVRQLTPDPNTTENHGCPCGCEHSDGNPEAIYDDNADIGTSQCVIHCPLFYPLSPINPKKMDYRCDGIWSDVSGNPCECRVDPDKPDNYVLLEETGNWGLNDINSNIDPCPTCCPDECEVCGWGNRNCVGPGPQGMYDIPKEDEDMPGKVYVGDGCATIPKSGISCVDRYVGVDGSLSFPGYYPCEGGCRYGCEVNGFEHCDPRPKLDGTSCIEGDCNNCNPGFRSFGVCWLEDGCNSEITRDSCVVLGGIWKDSCDGYIPPSQIPPTPKTIQSRNDTSQINVRKYSGLLKKYPNTSIQNMVESSKTYTPIYENGIIVGHNVELEFKPGTIGTTANISNAKPLVSPTKPVVLSQPIQFQLVNFVASEKKKTELRDSKYAQGSLSLISKAEMKSDASLGHAGYENNKASTTIIEGELTASIQKDGMIGEGLLISFVSGSNIKLDTNEAKNIIRISVDDLYLHELIDVSEATPSDNDILQWHSTTGLWTPTQPGQGPVGPTGPVGGADEQILYNQNGEATGSNNLKYDYSSNVLQINADAYLYDGFTSSGDIQAQDNTIERANLKDYSESFYDNGTVAISVEFDFENGNVQKVKVGGIDTGNSIQWTFTNAPTSGTVGTMTIIFEDAESHSGGLSFGDIKWSGGHIPTLSVSGTDIISFTTLDGGSGYYGFVGGLGFTG